MYWLLFVDSAGGTAWLSCCNERELPRSGQIVSQSYGRDRKAAVAACQKLQNDGYKVAACDLA